jgi:3-methyladenine DNA glycosylase/8-oxoguanine DNA glycosylase
MNMKRSVKSAELELEETLSIKPIQPYSLELTTKKLTRFGIEWYWTTPFELSRKGVIWVVSPLESEEQLVGFKVFSNKYRGQQVIKASIYLAPGHSENERNSAKEIVVGCLNPYEDISEFYAMGKKHAYLKKAIIQMYGMRVSRFPTLFSAIIMAICLQRASYGRTEKMIKSLCIEYGTNAQFDGVHILSLPTAQRVSETSVEELKMRCKVGYRATFLLEAAQAVWEKELPTLTDLNKMPFEEASSILTELKGIGTYSAEVICSHPAFPIDAWSSKRLGSLFGIFPSSQEDSRDASERIKQYAERQFGVWQRYSYEYLINSLEHTEELGK